MEGRVVGGGYSDYFARCGCNAGGGGVEVDYQWADCAKRGQVCLGLSSRISWTHTLYFIHLGANNWACALVSTR